MGKSFDCFGIKPEVLEGNKFARIAIGFGSDRYYMNLVNNQIDEKGEGEYFSEPLIPIYSLDGINSINVYRNVVFDYMLDISVVLSWDYRLPFPLNPDTGEDYIPKRMEFGDVIDINYLIKNNFHFIIVCEGTTNFSIYCKDGKVSVLEDAPNNMDVTPALDEYLKSGKIFDKRIELIAITRNDTLGRDIMIIMDDNLSIIDDVLEVEKETASTASNESINSADTVEEA